MSDNFYRSTPVLLDGKVYFLPLDIASREIMVTQLESDPQEVLNVAKRPAQAVRRGSRSDRILRRPGRRGAKGRLIPL